MANRFPVLAAYDHCLKCSHLFNLLDARGVISTTERAALMGRVRGIACKTALGIPSTNWWPCATPRGAGVIKPVRKSPTAAAERKLDLLFEIGCEEIPAGCFRAIRFLPSDRCLRTIPRPRVSTISWNASRCSRVSKNGHGGSQDHIDDCHGNLDVVRKSAMDGARQSVNPLIKLNVGDFVAIFATQARRALHQRGGCAH